MKIHVISFSVPLLLAFSAVDVAAESAAPLYVPTRISFEDLIHGGSNASINDGDVFWKTLREVGLLSITNVPNLNKQSMLKDLEDCLHGPQAGNSNNNSNNIGAPDFALQGGGDDARDHYGHHRRRTLATHTLAGRPEGMFVATKNDPERNNDDVCGDLQTSSRKFREAIQTVSEAIAARFGSVASAVTIRDPANNGNGNSFLPVERVINEGEHLEHFHSYYASGAADAAAATTSDSDTSTIDWHTDQGMMLLFTPGQQKDGKTSDGFFIRLKDGSTVELDFDSEVDDLVVMLGDGVNQYINDGTDNHNKLRSVPHALALANSSSAPRLWYGRMVLPPPSAIHPRSASSSNHGSPSSSMMTFGELRNSMIRGEESALRLGCASPTMVVARDLSEEWHEDDGGTATCDEDTSMMCWMRCMDYTKYDISPASCDAKGDDHALECANSDGELWQDGIHDSAYTMRCLATNDTATDGDDASSDDADEESSSSSTTFAGLTILGTSTAWMGLVLAMMSG